MNKCLFGGCSRKDLLHSKDKVMEYSCCKDCPEKDCDVRCTDRDKRNKCKWLQPEIISTNAFLVSKKASESTRKRKSKDKELTPEEMNEAIEKSKEKRRQKRELKKAASTPKPIRAKAASQEKPPRKYKKSTAKKSALKATSKKKIEQIKQEPKKEKRISLW